jgi:hypothetical protein
MIVQANDDGLDVVYRALRQCFACHQPLDDPAKVYWSGFSEDGSDNAVTFGLHAGCAANLAIHLASDALKADLANHRAGSRNGSLNFGTPLST